MDDKIVEVLQSKDVFNRLSFLSYRGHISHKIEPIYVRIDSSKNLFKIVSPLDRERET
jgi:hypothetical protein